MNSDKTHADEKWHRPSIELAKEDVPQEKYEKLSKDEIRKNLLGDGNFPLTERLHRANVIRLTRIRESVLLLKLDSSLGISSWRQSVIFEAE